MVTPPARKLGWKRRLLFLAILGAVAVPLVGEGLARVAGRGERDPRALLACAAAIREHRATAADARACRRLPRYLRERTDEEVFQLRYTPHLTVLRGPGSWAPDVTRVNLAGYNDDFDLLAPKPLDETRVAIMGDSMTRGFGLADDYAAAYPTVAESRANEILGAAGSKRTLRLDNFGVGRYNARESLGLLLSRARYRHPDHVIYAFFSNDLEQCRFNSCTAWRSRESNLSLWYDPRASHGEDVEVGTLARFGFDLISHSAFAAFVEDALDELTFAWWIPFHFAHVRGGPLDPLVRAVLPAGRYTLDPDELDEGFVVGGKRNADGSERMITEGLRSSRITLLSILQMAKEARRMGATFSILVMPEHIEGVCSGDVPHAQDHPVLHAAKRALPDLDIIYADPALLMEAGCAMHLVVNGRPDEHLSPLGHAVMAGVLVDAMQERGWLEP